MEVLLVFLALVEVAIVAGFVARRRWRRRA
jgi:hypothetical protein